MKIYYNDADITAQSKATACIMHDSAGGEADSLTIIFSDAIDVWTNWSPERGDTLRLVTGDFDSGTSYVDDVRFLTGAFRVDAVSVPQSAYAPRTKIWRKASLSAIVHDIAKQCGLSAQTYNLANYMYTAITQACESDLAFLSRICMREGYAIKVSAKTLIVYNEREMERATPTITIREKDAKPGYDFSQGVGLLSSARVIYYNQSKGEAYDQTATDSNIVGGTRLYCEMCATVGEAQRFAYGYLRAANKNAHCCTLAVPQQTAVAAGSTVNLSGFGKDKDGAWFVGAIDLDAISAVNTLYLRKPLSY